jgi:hypothetical protein
MGCNAGVCIPLPRRPGGTQPAVGFRTLFVPTNIAGIRSDTSCSVRADYPLQFNIHYNMDEINGFFGIYPNDF